MSTNNNGRYVRFEPKYDNANEVISATHINKLQDTSERVQQGIFTASDRDFIDKTLFILEHHRTANGMWSDTFDDTTKIDLVRSTHVVYSELEKGVAFPETSTSLEGWLYSKPYINPNRSNMKQVMVVANAFIPSGTYIYTEISNNGADWYEIPLSDSNLFEIPSDGNKLMLRAKFTRNALDLSPRIDAWAILFRDPRNDIITLPDGREVTVRPGDGDSDFGGIVELFHHQLMGIGPNDHHDQEHTHDGTDGSGLISHDNLTDVGEDDHHEKDHTHGEDGVSYVNVETDIIGTVPVENLSYQLWTGKPGTTGLYFDPNMDDRLVYVKSPDDETYLFYDLIADRLSHTITIVQGIAVWEQMIFGEYINSKGETTVVLKGTEKTHYDASDSIIREEIQKVAAPMKPSGLVAEDLGTGTEIKLDWSPNTELDLVGYDVYRSSDEGVTWILCNTSGIVTSTSYVVGSLTTGAEYQFAIVAIDNTAYVSDKSDSVTIRPTLADTIAPNQVQNVNAVRMNAGEVQVTWDPNTEVDLANYVVYMSASGIAGSFSIVQTVPAGTHQYLHTDLMSGNTYYYYVRATDTSDNQGTPSVTVSVIA